MIITCPSCATPQSLSRDEFASDGIIIKCPACHHSWLEARAVEVIDASDVTQLIQDDINNQHRDDGFNDQAFNDPHNGPASLPALIQTPNPEYEAARIAKAVKQAEHKRLAAASKRREKQRGWLTLAACIAAPFAFAAAFPETVVQALPGSIAIYDKAGIDVNIPGFTIANITHQYVMAGGTRVLAIRGDIINISGKEKPVPSLRFALRDKARKEVYNWTLSGISRRALRPGLATSFLTRVASPPKHADDFQIRFARTGEIAKTASYESNSNQRSQN